jgi:hypothetical protein
MYWYGRYGTVRIPYVAYVEVRFSFSYLPYVLTRISET